MAFVALLDADVLWPAALRCTLLRAAELRNPPLTVFQVVEGLRRITPKFSETVLASGLLEQA